VRLARAEGKLLEEDVALAEALDRKRIGPETVPRRIEAKESVTEAA